MVVIVQRTVEILWKLRTGATWLDIPEEFVLGKQHITALIVGHLKACGIIFFKLRGVLDQEWVFIDGSYIRALACKWSSVWFLASNWTI